MDRVPLLSPRAVFGEAGRTSGMARRLPSVRRDPMATCLERGWLETWKSEADCATTVIPAGRVRQMRQFLKTCNLIARIARREQCAP